MTQPRTPASAWIFVVRRKDGQPDWYGKWHKPTQVRRKLGPAWLEADDGSYTGKKRKTRFDGWLKRQGRPRPGWLTEEDALKVLRQKQAQHAERVRRLQAGGVPTFREAAVGWLEERRTVAGARRKTLEDWASLLRDPDDEPRKRGRAPSGRIMERFGDVPLDEITEREVSAFLRSLDRIDLAARTVNKYRSVLNGVFVWAMRKDTHGEVVAANPVESVPKRREGDTAELVVYTPDEVDAIAGCTSTELDAAVIVTAAFTGLRLSELLALRWRDVDFANERLRVQRRYVGGELTSPKSRRERSVPLSGQTASVLTALAHRATYTGANDLVFAGPQGEYLDGSALARRYKAARDRARAENPAIPPLRFHDLRHTFGSLCAAAGINVVTIQSMMGHSSLRTTQRYMHHAPSAEDAARLTAAFALRDSPSAP